MSVEIPLKLVEVLRKARRIAVLTGAGISAESGVPTFREAQTGLWSQYDPQQLATPQAFRRDPKLVWDWYAWRRTLVSNAYPNDGHIALASMASKIERFSLITQNVDSLHQRAGSSGVIELHGNISRIKCFSCDEIALEYQDQNHVPPYCDVCGGLLRPDVVWFGENLPEKALSAAFEAARHCDVFFSIGTSALVQPAASLPLTANDYGAVTVEVNPERTPISGKMNFLLSGPAGEILPALVKSVWGV